jgi:hypothetical protein
MRTLITATLALALVAPAVAADPVAAPSKPATTAAAQAVPAANKALLDRLLPMAQQASAAASTGLEVAKAATAVPFSGKKAQEKAASAQKHLDAATSLQNDLTALSKGQAISKDSLLNQFSKGSPSAGDSLKGNPIAEKLSQILATPGVTDALVSFAPVDKIPGYATIAPMLGGAKAP